jgi:hypothetical protein
LLLSIVNSFDSRTIVMANWKFRDIADRIYVFPPFSLGPTATVRVWTKAGTDDASNLYMGRGAAVWNNEGDTAWLRDADGDLIDEYSYQGD